MGYLRQVYNHLTLETHLLDVLVAIIGTSALFGIWQKRLSAGAFMFGVLMFITIFAALLLKFALGKYHFQ